MVYELRSVISHVGGSPDEGKFDHSATPSPPSPSVTGMLIAPSTQATIFRMSTSLMAPEHRVTIAMSTYISKTFPRLVGIPPCC